MASTQKRMSKKEKTEQIISKFAFLILFALCIQFLVYVFILNIVPTMVNRPVSSIEDNISVMLNSETLVDSDGERGAFLNPLYGTDRYYTTNGYFKFSVENPTSIIYYYNMVLLVATIILILYYMVSFMENSNGKMWQKIKSFLKTQWPLTVLMIFMIWVFISSLLAYDSYRSFVGCFNLKDGYLSFMMYASMLICSLFLAKNNEKYKKILVNTFLITATFLAVITLWNHFYLNSENSEYSIFYYLKNKDIESADKLSYNDIGGTYLITYGKDPSKTVVTLGELLFGNGGMPLGKNFLIVTKRVLGETNSGIFHNSNHYGYYLSICVIVAAVMAIKEEKTWLSTLYFASYVVMLEMAIINNTLGAYLGIAASIIFMIIYALIPKGVKSVYLKELLWTGLILVAFIALSAVTVNPSGKNIVYSNFAGLAKDFNILVGKQESTSSNGENTSEVSGEKENEQESNAKDDIGSGRGVLWKDALIMATQKPFFGYGLENILYEYNEQFGVSEGRSHNLVLQLAATTGIVGMLLYVVGVAAIWIRKLKYLREWNIYECLGMFVTVSYIISSLVGNSGFYTSGYFYIFFGFIALSIPNEKKEISNKK